MKAGAASPVPDAIAAALILAVAMGFGRFSFTGMYPLMVHEGLLTVSGGSLAASANYFGYLAGALGLSRVHHRHSARLCQAAMAGTVLCLAALSLNLGLSFVLTVRLLAGVFSALAMVTATTWLFQVVGYHQGAPILFSGVGIGILVSAELIAGAGGAGLRSAADWSILGTASAVACAFALLRVGRQPDVLLPDQADFRDPTGQSERPIAARMLILVYGLAGFGYIVTATYLPVFMVGTVTIAMPAAKRIAATLRYNMVAAMTAAYGIGQIGGPLVSDALFAHLHSFNPPLLAAGGALLIAALGCMV